MAITLIEKERFYENDCFSFTVLIKKMGSKKIEFV